MYITLYDTNLNALTHPITHALPDITEKAFDFDEIKITGNLDGTVIDPVIFRLDDDTGNEIYSGLVKKLLPKDKTVEVIGRDFKEIFSTEILLDYVVATPPTTVHELFDYIINQFRNNLDTTLHELPFVVQIPEDNTDITPIFGNPMGQVLVVNAYDYLLPFIKYYGYVIRKSVDWSNKQLVFTFDKERTTRAIKLDDFVHEMQQNDPTINKCIALMQKAEYGYEWKKQQYTSFWKDILPLVLTWTALEYPTGSLEDNQRYAKTGKSRTMYEYKLQKNMNTNQSYPSYDGTCQIGYEFRNGFCIPIPRWVDVVGAETIWEWEWTIPSAAPNYRYVKTGTTHVQNEWKKQEYVTEWLDVEPIVTQWLDTQPTSTDPTIRWIQTGEMEAPIGAVRYYYLTKDNQIIEGDSTGDISNRYYPPKTKVFMDNYLANAQYNSILELGNNRYVDNIYLDVNNPLNPINLDDLMINDLVDVYTDKGFFKQLPVSEKILKASANGVKKRVKLGFKKELLTDILKGEFAKDKTIKSQPTGDGEVTKEAVESALGYTPSEQGHSHSYTQITGRPTFRISGATLYVKL